MENGRQTCATCTGLIRLCGGLDFFPADSEVRRLLVERLHRLAHDHQHAARMINRWLDSEKVAPKVSDLVRLASEVPTTVHAALPLPCPDCEGLPGDFVIVERGLYSGAARCSCPRGRALAARDAAAREGVGDSGQIGRKRELARSRDIVAMPSL